MKAINHVSLEDILAIDIETVRIVDEVDNLSPDFMEAFRMKKKQEGVVPPIEDLRISWKEAASLWPEFSKVCAISIAYMRKGKLRCTCLRGDNEAVLLQQFSDILDSLVKFKPSFRLVAHAGLFFDYPFLCKRYLLNWMDIPSILDESIDKPWEKKAICTNELWRSFGTGSGSSLQALCTAFGIESSKVDLVGDQVGVSYFNGEFDRIAEYCNRDAIACFNLFAAYKGIRPIAYEDVEIVEPKLNAVRVGLLDKLFKTKKVTPALEAKLREEFNGLPEEEKPIARSILKATLLSFESKSLSEEHKNLINSL